MRCTMVKTWELQSQVPGVQPQASDSHPEKRETGGARIHARPSSRLRKQGPEMPRDLSGSCERAAVGWELHPGAPTSFVWRPCCPPARLGHH